MTPYEARVRELEEEGCCTSDAQGIADVEFIQKAAVTMYEALRLMVGYSGHSKTVDERLSIAKTALSKARGER